VVEKLWNIHLLISPINQSTKSRSVVFRLPITLDLVFSFLRKLNLNNLMNLILADNGYQSILDIASPE